MGGVHGKTNGEGDCWVMGVWGRTRTRVRTSLFFRRRILAAVSSRDSDSRTYIATTRSDIRPRTLRAMRDSTSFIVFDTFARPKAAQLSRLRFFARSNFQTVM